MLRKTNVGSKVFKQDYPKPSPFVISKRKKVLTKVYDENGKAVSQRENFKVFHEVISEDDYFNPQVTADMFSVEAQSAAGVNLTPVNAPFFESTIDERAAFADSLEKLDLDDYLHEPVSPSSSVVSNLDVQPSTNE